MAQSQQPNVIFLDMMMPDFNGKETLAQLQACPATRDIPVFWLAAKVQALELKQYNGVVRATIEKPFDPLSLADAIADALGWNATNAISS
ncbi:MAG: response regulator [Okeania sp. SIO2H7]|nr:response regulator [Okeania sp. SIO2H7]